MSEPTKKAEIGILYVATKDKFFPEAEQAALTAKEHMPDVPIAIFTQDVEAAKAYDCFDHVIEIEEPYCDFRDKMLAFKKTPFERNLYVDTDTAFLHSVFDVFYVLEQYDLAFAHEPHRWNETNLTVPECFPEPNCGVLAFRDSDRFQDFNQAVLEDYSAKMEKRPEGHEGAREDQGTIRKILFQGDHGLKLWVLPNEYNLRAYMPYFACYKVKIAHCRGKYLDRAKRKLNRSFKMRTGDGMNVFERGWFNFKDVLKGFIGRPIPWASTEHKRANWNWQASKDQIAKWTGKA